MRKRKKLVLAAATCALLTLGLAVGCAPRGDAADDDGEAVVDARGITAEEIGGWEENEDGDLVRTLDDGRQVQLCPSWQNSLEYPSNDLTLVPGSSSIVFNDDILKANERGCGSCHENLWETLGRMDMAHLGAARYLPVDFEVQQCIDCHMKEEDAGFSWNAGFGPMMHGIHSVNEDDPKATCFNCHETDWKTGDLKLWDEVKYDNVLQGITRLPNANGEFTFTQDAVTPTENLFNVNWMYYPLDQQRYENEQGHAALDEDLFNNWTIAVSGEVDNPQEWKLVDLIEQAPVETRVWKMHCEINPLGGPLIGQVEVKGISLKWLFEQAGLKESAKGFTAVTPDGEQYQHETVKDVDLAALADSDALIVYEINGERIPWDLGYPCQIWVPSIPASHWMKMPSEIIVRDFVQDGVDGGIGRGMVGPANIGFTNTVEGQIIKAGEPFTFEGYADGWTNQIVAVEFSFDNGETWTRFDTPGTNTEQWVTWSFTWTPEAGKDTAYVLSARAVLADGTTTAEPMRIMVNAKANA